MSKRIKKRREERILDLGKKELIFNIISLTIIICIGLYFGVRSFYYYGRETKKVKQEANTLNGTLLKNNKVTKDGDGLHQDKDGYYFKGNNLNNYVSFGNRVFRVIGINNNGSVKVVSDICGGMLYGEEVEYDKSNIYSFLTKTSVKNSGVYYDTIPNITKFLDKTNYNEESINGNSFKNIKKYSDYVSLLSIEDYTKSGLKNGYLNIGKYFWLLGRSKDNSNLYVDESGEITNGTSYEAYGVRAVITIKKNMLLTGGDGSNENPYVIKQDKDVNYVDKYVKLGNDLYKVYGDSNNILRLNLNSYISVNGSIYNSSFSNSSSVFDSSDKKNIAYYLNNTFYNSLSYKDLLLDSNFNLGEFSNDSGLKYESIYNNVLVFKVGLLNMFDYNTNSLLDDYFIINNTGEVSSLVYVNHANGIIEESDVVDYKRVVPVISIYKNIIKSGTGSFTDPFIV